MSEPDLYLLGRAGPEEERLKRQIANLAPDSDQQLERVGIRPGERVVDLGCGPGGVLHLIGKRVGPTGSVLVNVPRPELIVLEMVSLVRPGGWIASFEADFLAHICDPPLAAWDRLLAAYIAYSAARGIDLHIGRRLHRLFRDAGVEAITVDAVEHVYPPGHDRRPILRDFINNVRDSLVAEGFVSQAELADDLAALDRHLADPKVLVTSHLFFRLTGRVPEALVVKA
ncbi:hypothetical protein ACQKGL_00555 [Ensifer adhaerens]|uniref:hypothetical protein n=1 Tax=Ensifer adhaerens TaxID=106592 RepID=UPI003CFDF6D1